MTFHPLCNNANEILILWQRGRRHEWIRKFTMTRQPHWIIMGNRHSWVSCKCNYELGEWAMLLLPGLCTIRWCNCIMCTTIFEIKMSSKTLVYLEISTKCLIWIYAQRANAKKAERELNMQWHKPSILCIFRIHKFHVWIMMISYNSYYWIRGRRNCKICTHYINTNGETRHYNFHWN